MDRNRMCTRMMTLAAAAVLVSGTALAQTPMGTGQPATVNDGAVPNANLNGKGATAMMGSTQDKKFAKSALADGMAEVQLGQLAQQKSNSDDVKKFAQQMVDDHTKLNDQMKPIAATVGVQPPTDLMPKDKALMTKLQALQGDEFDKAYIKAMMKDHKLDNKEFETEANAGQNPQEKDAAAQGGTIIKQHLEMIQTIAKAHGVEAGKAM